jgi:hypothetical protein
MVNVVESAAAWLVEHPDSVDVRVGLLATVRRLGAASPVPVSDVVESAAAWLAKHPEAQHVRAALTAATESCAS